MLGMIVIFSSTTVFGSYALWYVGQNKLNGEYMAPQQFLLITGAGILVGGLYIVVKSKSQYTVNQGNHELK
jgi:hypothetical protein